MLITDSSFASLDEALLGIEFPSDIRDTLALISVRYLSFDGCLHRGQLVVHADLASDVRRIFKELLRIRFPIEKVIPVSMFGWDDDASMAANNSCSFNYRFILGTTRLSLHSFGIALDLNPMQNPCFGSDGSVCPPKGIYDPSVPGTITADGPVVAIFLSLGWEWGGHWTSLKDYQHFQKPR